MLNIKSKLSSVPPKTKTPKMPDLKPLRASKKPSDSESEEEGTGMFNLWRLIAKTDCISQITGNWIGYNPTQSNGLLRFVHSHKSWDQKIKQDILVNDSGLWNSNHQWWARLSSHFIITSDWIMTKCIFMLCFLDYTEKCMAACLAAQQSPDLMRAGKIGSRLTCLQCLYYIYFIHTQYTH